jgi:tetratricopeptide (TPR) repeat protein
MNESNWQSLLNAGIQAIRQQQPALALKRLESAFSLAPADVQVRYWLGNACRMTGDARRAEKFLRDLLAEVPADEQTSFALAFLLRDEGRPAEAAEVLLELAGTAAENIELLLKITGFLRDSNQFSAAIKVCRQAVELAPERAQIHFNLARLYQATGAFEAALPALRKALKISPALGGAWLSLSSLQRFGGDDDDDFILLKRASQQTFGNETDMCVAFAMGKALDDMQCWGKAWLYFVNGNRLRMSKNPYKGQHLQLFKGHKTIADLFLSWVCSDPEQLCWSSVWTSTLALAAAASSIFLTTLPGNIRSRNGFPGSRAYSWVAICGPRCASRVQKVRFISTKIPSTSDTWICCSAYYLNPE